MCTVTVIPWENKGGYRMVCNRDELRNRTVAEMPSVFERGERRCVMPIDPHGGGTWVSANDAGLGMTLLNLNLPLQERPPVRAGMLSRGTIIPDCMAETCVGGVLDRLDGLDPSAVLPFRLVVLDEREMAVIRSDGREVVVSRSERPRVPWMITSSGLGDHRVEGPRRDLFDTWFGHEPGVWVEKQDGYHRHWWPDQTKLSVCMRRPDAKTVSLTEVCVGDKGVTMRYVPGPPDRTDVMTELTIEKRVGANG